MSNGTHDHDHPKPHHDHTHDSEERASAVRSADDTGMISGEVSITQAEIEHPEAFEEHPKKG
jgi:hypothetical protein